MDSNKAESQFEIRYRYAGAAYRYASFSKFRIRLIATSAAALIALPTLFVLKSGMSDQANKTNPFAMSPPGTQHVEETPKELNPEVRLSAQKVTAPQTEAKAVAPTEALDEPTHRTQPASASTTTVNSAAQQPTEAVAFEEVKFSKSPEGLILNVHLRNKLDSKLTGKLIATLKLNDSKTLTAETAFSMRRFVAKNLSFTLENLQDSKENLEVEIRAVDSTGNTLIHESLTRPIPEGETNDE